MGVAGIVVGNVLAVTPMNVSNGNAQAVVPGHVQMIAQYNVGDFVQDIAGLPVKVLVKVGTNTQQELTYWDGK